ncbi:cupredoxin domain-containing protein [Capillimicrobium parvum]|uniref:Lipoprotein n=1 Tax=Capillimicrobium parvum TaxID=2884022 RepID=A0A9E7BZL4_9ACTN|nr:cupredoxin domain-containing protein [Capillimicrobium parvum]UGS34679.1 hypothetical protein DSM104329_01059 [Capillimicrobium parvum]
MASRRAAALAAVLTIGAAALAGCGGDGSSSTGTAPAPAATATAPAGASTSGEDQPGGGGDEQPIVVPARFTFSGDGLSPAEVAVPAFFDIRLTGVSKDGRAHTILFEGTTLQVPAHGRASAKIGGLKKGRYGVTIDGQENAATIVSGAEPGP